MNELKGKVIEILIENIAMHILICFKLSQYIALHKLHLSHSPMGGGGQVHFYAMKTQVNISMKSVFHQKFDFFSI